MNYYSLFSDVSVNPQLKVSIGGYFLLPFSTDFILQNILEISQKNSINIKCKIFENTSSTKSEIQTLIWALSEIEKHIQSPFKLEICTDSQGITSLISRKKRLIQSNFTTGKNEPYRNANLYELFFEYQNRFNFDVIKIKGHSPKSQKDNLQLMFTQLDRKVRKELREIIQNYELKKENEYE